MCIRDRRKVVDANNEAELRRALDTAELAQSIHGPDGGPGADDGRPAGHRTRPDGGLAGNPRRDAGERHAAHPLRLWQQAFHVAVDRWTGGASDGALYSVLEPYGVKWEPIRLRLDPHRIPEALRDPATALLLLVLDSFACGRIPLGFGTNRGLGALAASKWEVGPESWLRIDDGNLEPVRPGTLLGSVSEEKLRELRSTWAAWIAREAERMAAEAAARRAAEATEAGEEHSTRKGVA